MPHRTCRTTFLGRNRALLHTGAVLAASSCTQTQAGCSCPMVARRGSSHRHTRSPAGKWFSALSSRPQYAGAVSDEAATVAAASIVTKAAPTAAKKAPASGSKAPKSDQAGAGAPAAAAVTTAAPPGGQSKSADKKAARLAAAAMVKAEKAAKLAAVETQRAAKGGSDAAKKAKAKAPALPKEDLNTKELVAGPPEKVSRSAEGPADRTACNSAPTATRGCPPLRLP